MIAASPMISVLDVMESEKLAADFYAGMAAHTNHPLGKRLFTQLEQFERYHFQKLSLLEENLRDNQAYIKYERHEVPTTPRMAPQIGIPPESMDPVGILQEAIERESQAEEEYLRLADQITDPDGHYMFSRMSEEEHLHFHILKEALWSLSHNGSWEWSIR